MRFAFLHTYSPLLANAVGKASPARCRALVNFAFSLVPRELMRIREIQLAFDEFELGGDDNGDFQRRMETLEHNYRGLSYDAQDRGEESLSEELYRIQSIFGALWCVAGKPQLGPLDVDGCLYQLVDVMQGEPKRRLEEFIAGWD